MSDLMSDGHAGATLSAVLVYGFGVVGPTLLLVWAVVRTMRHRRMAAAADASADTPARLAAGPAVLFGQVEYARDARHAVRVEIDQDGDESESSGHWTHRWTEKDRRVLVDPFYLRINPETRIRVEPTREVFLVDDMAGLIRVNLTKRTRFAELSPGESIYASGELVRAPDPEANSSAGYRSARDGWILRSPHGKTMLLSSESLGSRFIKRARFHTAAAILIGLALVVMNALFLGYHLRVVLGHTERARVAKLDHYMSYSDGNATDHYRVWLTGPDGGKFDDHIDAPNFGMLAVGDEVVVRYLPGGLVRSSTIGPDATASYFAWALPVMFVGLWLTYRGREQSSRPWYERKVIETGSGRLEETLLRDKAATTDS